MAERKKALLDIRPAYQTRKASIVLLDTAEDLVESLDSLSICLKHIEEKYLENSGNKEQTNDGGLYDKLKENLEAARDLTDTLKREKWRLGRREMSLNLRMGELEDYKKHMKEDMTDMTETVEVLSMRVVQLENALCEQQDVQESLEAEESELKKRLQESEEKCSDLEEQKEKMLNDIKYLRLQRSDSYYKKQTEELLSEKEVLQLENRNLKEMIREKDALLDNMQSETNDKTEQTTVLVNDTVESEPKLPEICILSTEDSQIAYV